MKYSTAKQAIDDIGRDKLEELIDQYSIEAVEAAVECDVALSNFEEAYQGEHDSDEAFVQQLLEDTGDIPKLPHYIHIDWERTAHDVMMDYCEAEGHYFRCL